MYILFFNELIQFRRRRRCVRFPNTNTIRACIGNTGCLKNNVPILNDCNSLLINGKEKVQKILYFTNFTNLFLHSYKI